MRLGFAPGSWSAVAGDGLALVSMAERLGFDSVWIAESWGTDAFTPLAAIAARCPRIRLGTGIAQIAARTPAMTAMTASTLDMLSDGRLLLGLGISGPQVVEGWHGQPFERPLARMREHVAIVREIMRRERTLEHHGDCYDIPYRGADGRGLGKALKLIQHPLRAEVPIYLGAIGPRNITLAGEIADGWIPLLMSPQRFDDVLAPPLTRGLQRSGRALTQLDIAPLVWTVVGDDLDECRRSVKRRLARTIGGYGARSANFYKDLVVRYGNEDVASRIQTLWLGGEREQAAAAVPDALVDELALVGPERHIAEQLQAWQASPATTLIAYTTQPEALRTLAKLLR
jgi:F420-dependent oxidoreductase-like protein